MIEYIALTTVVVIFYICLGIVVFAPTIYAFWFYVISRKMPVKRKGLLRIALTTLVINGVVAYFLFQLAFHYLLVSKVAERDAIALSAVRTAVVSQQNFFASHGRYYSVGPVRGPYEDENGLKIEKDVILQVVPVWDEAAERDAFQAYATHVHGRNVCVVKLDGTIVQAPPESAEVFGIRAKLVRSVK